LALALSLHQTKSEQAEGEEVDLPSLLLFLRCCVTYSLKLLGLLGPSGARVSGFLTEAKILTTLVLAQKR
jgi:hypothetical protein